LNARVDQAGAELGKKDDADGQRQQSGDVERDDAPGETGEALADEELPGALQPAADPGETAGPQRRGLIDGRGLDRGLDPGRSVGLRGGPCDFCGSIEHVVCRGSDHAPLLAGMDAITTARQPSQSAALAQRLDRWSKTRQSMACCAQPTLRLP